MPQKIFFLITFLQLATPAQAAAEKFYERQWLSLMRYSSGWLGYTSQVDSPEYFLSEEGKSDPKKEWLATIEQMNRAPSAFSDLNLHPVCRFPGRYMYLKAAGEKLPDFPLTECKDFQRFKNKLNIGTVSLIFSSYYVSRPASAFGHTLFKIRSRASQSGTQLLDYGVDYSAAVTTSNPILYGVFGIVGGFNGRFNVMPYFLKLREYSDYDSRDLWEFQLNLSEKQKQLFVAHLWDMDKAYFQYFYFTENCSYHVYRFLDAVAPNWQLFERISPITAPIDTLTPFLENSPHLAQLNYRPSLLNRLKKSYELLSEKQKLQFSTVLEDKNLSSLKDSPENAELLDAASLYIDYKYAKQMQLNEGEEAAEVQKFKLAILSKRSKIKKTTQQTFQIDDVKPTPAHKSRRFRFGLGNSRIAEGFQRLEYRYGLHSLEDFANWYNPYSTLEMGLFQVEREDLSGEWRVREVQLAHVIALRPVHRLFKKVSWNFKIGGSTIEELDSRPLAPQIEAGVGYTAAVGPTVVAAFLQSNQFFSGAYQNGHRFDLGYRLLFKSSIRKWSFVSQYSQLTILSGGQHSESKAWLNRLSYAYHPQAAVALDHESFPDEDRIAANLVFYLQ